MLFSATLATCMGIWTILFYKSKPPTPPSKAATE